MRTDMATLRSWLLGLLLVLLCSFQTPLAPSAAAKAQELPLIHEEGLMADDDDDDDDDDDGEADLP